MFLLIVAEIILVAYTIMTLYVIKNEEDKKAAYLMLCSFLYVAIVIILLATNVI